MLFDKKLLEELGNTAELTVDKNGEAIDRDLQIATVLLLIQLGHIDDELDAAEITALVRSVGHSFTLGEVEVGELLELADIVRKSPGALNDAVELINQSFSATQKEEVLSVVWKVILSDGVADKLEARYAALVRERLGLGLDAAIRARQKAENS